MSETSSDGGPSPTEGESADSPIEMLRKNRALMRLGGGEARLEAQRSKGKLGVWDRIEAFFDEGTFVEVGAFVELRSPHFGLDKKRAAGDGVVTGFGRVNGDLVYLAAQDFTVLGGSLGEMHGKKIANLLDMALKAGAPVVMMNDSGGARIQEGIGALCGYGDIFFRNTRASGVIPQISLIMGPCAGGAVYSPGITDFVAMVKGTSNMFITGPEVIKTVTGETVSKDSLGGPDVHMARSGVATYIGEDDEATLAWVSRLLTYIPPNNQETTPIAPPVTRPAGSAERLRELVPDDPSKAYDMHEVIEQLVDGHSFFELQDGYAENIIIGFCRIDGISTGVIANNPKHLAGCIDVNASDKAARFVRFCDAFNIPLLTLVDVPGFLPGVDQEYAGIIRHGAKLLYAYSEATVPKLTVILRKAYGGAYICMCSKHLGADMVISWPAAEIAVMGPKGAVNIIFRKQIEASDDTEAAARKCEADYIETFANPRMAASLGYIDDIVEPTETGNVIRQYLWSLSDKYEERPNRKHGNIPL
jgi:acetyl-CoA carboxylase carboxyltransferase component